MDQDVIISFCNEENEWCLKNVQTGKVRRLYSHRRLLVEDSEMIWRSLRPHVNMEFIMLKPR